MRRSIIGFFAFLVAFPLPTFALTPLVSIPVTPVIQVATTQTASITVLDAVQKPVAGVTVTVYTDQGSTTIADDTAKSGGFDAKATTDAQGKVTFTLVAGTYYPSVGYYDGSWTHTAPPSSFQVVTSVPTTLSMILDTVGSNVLVHVYDTVNVGQGMVGATVGMYIDQSMGKLADNLATPATKDDAQGVTNSNGDIGFLLAPGKYYYRMTKGSLLATGTVDAVSRVATNVGIRLPDATDSSTIPVPTAPCTPSVTTAGVVVPCTPTTTSTTPNPTLPCPPGEVNVGTTTAPVCRPIPTTDSSTPTSTTPCPPTLTSVVSTDPCVPPPPTQDGPCLPGEVNVGTTAAPVCRPIPTSIPTPEDPCKPTLTNVAPVDPCVPPAEEECPPGTKPVSYNGAEWCMGIVTQQAEYDLEAVSVGFTEEQMLTFSVKNNSQKSVKKFTYRLEWLDANNAAVATFERSVTRTILPGKTVKDVGMVGANYVNFFLALKANPQIVQVRLTVDPANTLAETNEDNNVAMSRTLPYGQRDLALQDLTLAGGDVIGFKVKNVGSYAVKSFTLGFAWLDATGHVMSAQGEKSRLSIPVIKSVKPGQSVTFPLSKSQNQKIVTFLGGMPAGALKLKVWVDVAAGLTDPTPENNVASIERSIDLRAETVELTKQESIGFSIKNEGSFSVKGFTYRVEVLDAGEQVLATFQKTTKTTLAPGKSLKNLEAVGKTWGAFVGEFKKHPEARTLRLTVDPDNAFIEMKEGNNVAVMGYAGYGARDLQVTNVKFPENVPWLDVRNNGERTINGFAWKLEWVNELGAVLKPELFVEYAYKYTSILPGKYNRFALSSLVKERQAKVFLAEKPSLAAGFKATVRLTSSDQHDVDLTNNAQSVIVSVIK